MNNFRVFLSLSIFIVSCYLLIDLIIYTFSWVLLFCSITGFIAVHYLWPPKYDNDSAWYDLLEVVIELPFRAISLFLRGIGKLFKNADAGLDL